MSNQALSAMKVIREFYQTQNPSFLKSLDTFCVANQECDKETVERNVITFLGNHLRQSASYIDILHEMKYTEALVQLKKIRDEISRTPRDGDHDVPSFIMENIEGMQGNRGYIWKGKVFLGKRPTKHGPRVLFEPRRKKTLIHVYEKGYHKVFEKIKGEKHQTLLRQTPWRVEGISTKQMATLGRPKITPVNQRSQNDAQDSQTSKKEVPKNVSRFAVLESESDSDSD